jgi:hypothetical protein
MPTLEPKKHRGVLWNLKGTQIQDGTNVMLRGRQPEQKATTR